MRIESRPGRLVTMSAAALLGLAACSGGSAVERRTSSSPTSRPSAYSSMPESQGPTSSDTGGAIVKIYKEPSGLIFAAYGAHAIEILDITKVGFGKDTQGYIDALLITAGCIPDINKPPQTQVYKGYPTEIYPVQTSSCLEGLSTLTEVYTITPGTVSSAPTTPSA